MNLANVSLELTTGLGDAVLMKCLLFCVSFGNKGKKHSLAFKKIFWGDFFKYITDASSELKFFDTDKLKVNTPKFPKHILDKHTKDLCRIVSEFK